MSTEITPNPRFNACARIRHQATSPTGTDVVILVRRDFRLDATYGLSLAESISLKHKGKIHVIVLEPRWLRQKNPRQFSMVARAIADVAFAAETLGMTYHCVGTATEAVLSIRSIAPRVIIEDQDPHSDAVAQLDKVLTYAREYDCTVLEVDNRNLIPVWVTSPKLEVGARTLRPKHAALLPAYIHYRTTVSIPFPQDSLTTEAYDALTAAISNRLPGYATRRNDPNVDGQSGLSPYLHLGVLPIIDVVIAISQSGLDQADKDAFLEEVLVRRELSDNHMFYRVAQGLAAAPAWALKSLRDHANDPREHVYTLEQFEQALTHDVLWNAAQTELLKTGKMHGYLRMYWAKKILEWTPSVEVAYDIALTLNDRYSLDGNDSNGDVGILWSLAGLHDRPWFDRPVYGVVRYMNANGAAKKFDVPGYCARIAAL
jgi:deoxyribodipyrimidine photo-lyase